MIRKRIVPLLDCLLKTMIRNKSWPHYDEYKHKLQGTNSDFLVGFQIYIYIGEIHLEP